MRIVAKKEAINRIDIAHATPEQFVFVRYTLLPLRPVAQLHARNLTQS
jgi:hypothetical protein